MPLTDGLVAWYKMDEASGTRADSSGNGNTLTATGGSVGSTTGIIGNAASFASGGGYLSRAQLITSGSFSFALFVKIVNDGSGDPNVMLQNGTGVQKISWSNGDSAFKGTSNNVAIVTTGADSFGVWYHLALTNDGTRQRFYQNGVLVDSNACVPNYTGLTSFEVGDSTQVGDLLVDLCGVWSRRLSGAEVSQLYNGGSGRDYPFSNPYTVGHVVAGGLVVC